MKVILNVDIKHLGEEGDVKNVAMGYARNYLLPRNLAVVYNPTTAAIFEAKRAEIEARKEIKRKDSASLKEKLDSILSKDFAKCCPKSCEVPACSALPSCIICSTV